jgi:S-adenosylmethionine-diacylglycerol 3-amino-3-carboxypropyl transferase
MNIHYAQCWEDPQVLRAALKVGPDDDVVSVASGGDNSLALLLDNPRTVTAIDRNPAQLYLVELKTRAMRTFEYDDFVSFLGTRPCADRDKLYNILRRALTENARAFWDSHPDHIKAGVIHCGKFERYFTVFHGHVLPLIHSRKTVDAFLSTTSREDQQKFYRSLWDNRRWRALFRVFFSRFLLSSMGRGREVFTQVKNNHVADTLLARTRRGLTEIPIHDNFFVHYILSGQFRDLATAHPYLSPRNLAGGRRRQSDFQV